MRTEIMLTNKEYTETINTIRKLMESGKVSADEALSWVRLQKLIMGPCFECKYNNGTPNGHCYNCGDK